jgi:hypothetical protein
MASPDGVKWLILEESNSEIQKKLNQWEGNYILEIQGISQAVNSFGNIITTVIIKRTPRH